MSIFTWFGLVWHVDFYIIRCVIYIKEGLFE
jgi:hypothetical protein